MAEIGIYGGSFNPVHYGHIGLIKWVLEHTDLDEIWMLVSPKSPHKTDRTDLDANYSRRLADVRQAVRAAGLQNFRTSDGALKRVVVSDFELSLPVPSYTANTLRELGKAFPCHEFSLIIGEDNWSVFDKWREYDYILGNYRIFIYPRHSKDQQSAGQSNFQQSEGRSNLQQSEGRSNLQQSEGRSNLQFLTGAPYFDISSTEIRAQKQNFQ